MLDSPSSHVTPVLKYILIFYVKPRMLGSNWQIITIEENIADDRPHNLTESYLRDAIDRYERDALRLSTAHHRAKKREFRALRKEILRFIASFEDFEDTDMHWFYRLFGNLYDDYEAINSQARRVLLHAVSANSISFRICSEAMSIISPPMSYASYYRITRGLVGMTNLDKYDL